METGWSIEKIQEILPQRYPFLFIDRVIEIDEESGRAVCVKNVTINDYYFKGHFPGNPIMPGVIITEAMAQAGIILYAALKPQIAKNKPDYYLGNVDIKFMKPVIPGNQLILEVEKQKLMDKGGIIQATAKVDGEAVAKGQIVFGVKPK